MEKRILKLRKLLNMSQKEFGNKLGVSTAGICQYERGGIRPSKSVLTLMAREFNVNRAWLEHGEGQIFKDHNSSEELIEMIKDVLEGDTMKKEAIIKIVSMTDTEFTKVMRAIEAIAEAIQTQ